MPEIYLLATNTKKPISHMITAYTGERFNHASVAFDRSLAECYSYSMAENGFVRETKETWPGWTTFELYAAQVTSAGFARARELVRDLSRERPDFSYRGVLGVAVGIPMESDEALFCSQFVEKVCIEAGLPRMFPDAALATPLRACARKGARLVAKGLMHEQLIVAQKGRTSSIFSEGLDPEIYDWRHT